MADTKCQNNIHLKVAELYCSSCMCLVCSRCFSGHLQHQVGSLDDIYEDVLKEIKTVASDIKTAITQKTEEKEKNKVIFETSITTHYDNQLSTITDYFRNLHDSLHYKEVELKRELKSYHDDNIQYYTEQLSKLDNQISESHQFIQRISNSNLPTENVELNIKFDLIQSYFSSKKIFKEKNEIGTAETETQTKNQDKQEELDKYQIYFLKATETNSNTLLDSLFLQKSKSKGTRIIVFGERGTEIFTRGRDSIYNKTLLLPHGSPNECSMQKNTYYMYQSNSFADKTYCFFKNNFWELNHDDAKPRWIIRASPIPHSALSTIYDGVDSIYIFGGFDGLTSTHLNSIWRFNVKTEKFELLPCTLPVAGCVFSLSVHENKIYVVGGYGKAYGGAIDRIDVLDTTTKTVTNICILKDVGFPIKLSFVGVYVHKLNCVYILDENRFYQYSLETKQLVKIYDLSTINIIGPSQYHKAKFYYDGDNTLHLFTSASKDLYTYNISENTWSKPITFIKFNVALSNYYAFILPK
ncbi:Kelch repeat-containing protein [Tieghemostelium lacteum]|uniref:Kelch repeat-containing protein n=1 Tax=Tieghemostelium lacteum TaxID=361077 RepID=A0A151ZCE8_TIELA|nr:Kelch repeat-containing protein [Tieghemostelium lacteum]|eukprot:KYQ91611.1 Kelch repeat-containing protein [Tieghemostelium lacteum]